MRELNSSDPLLTNLSLYNGNISNATIVELEEIFGNSTKNASIAQLLNMSNFTWIAPNVCFLSIIE